MGTTFALICFAWIFFRARNLADAVYVVTHIFRGWGGINSLSALRRNLSGLGLTQNEFLLALAAIAFMELIHLLERHGRIRHMLRQKPAAMRWTVYYALVISMFFWGVFGPNKFIYFQF